MYRVLSPSESGSRFTIIEIMDIAGVNTKDKSLSRAPDEFAKLQNILLEKRGWEKRSGSSTFGSAQSGNEVAALGFLEQNSGVTPLMIVNATLYKYVSNAWAASDKSDYTPDLFASIVTMTSKSGSSLDSGTTTAGSTPYYLEDTNQTWTPGEHTGRCVVIQGEVKLITDNDETKLFLGDKLNSDTDADYQSQAYNIYAVAPFAFIANGTDAVQKYDLTTHTPIDGTHVSGGRALPVFNFLSVHQGRLVGSKGSGNDNDRVFLMDQAIGENMTTDTNLNINLNFFNDGDSVVAHGSLPVGNGSVLLVAKHRSVHAIEGTNILNYTSRPVLSSVGCIAPKTFKIFGSNAFFLSHLGVMSIGNAEGQRSILDDPLPISEPIQDEIDALTDEEKANACGAFHNNRYYLQIGDNAWYYDLEASLRQQRHVWVDLDFPYAFNILTEIDNVLYGGRQTNGQAYRILSGTKDGTTNVVMQLESADISFPGVPNMWVDRIEVTGEPELSTVLRLQCAFDGGSYEGVVTQALDNQNYVYRFNIGKRCKSFRFRIAETGSQNPVRLHLPIRIFVAVSDFGEAASKQSSLSPS
jgi:hypothetical protein